MLKTYRYLCLLCGVTSALLKCEGPVALNCNTGNFECPKNLDARTSHGTAIVILRIPVLSTHHVSKHKVCLLKG